MNEETSQPKFTTGKRFWTYIRSQRKYQIGIPVLKDGKDEIIDSKMKAELLSKQYETVFTEEDTSKRLPDATQHLVERIEDLHISVVAVQNLLNSLNPKKANGPDQLPLGILKETANEIAPILRVIFMASLQQWAIPKDWRSANVVPVFKKGNRLSAENYQPISLTSICSKILEHIIYKHIMAHCEKHNILVDYQHGFRKSRSCETQLITVREEIAKWKDDGHNVDMLIMGSPKPLIQCLTSDSLARLRAMEYMET